MAGERVLVVDDSLVYRDLLVNHVLTPNGYEPLTANDGETGLRIAQQKVPDLIIMDLQMPGMTGLELIQHLQHLALYLPGDQVLLATAHYICHLFLGVGPRAEELGNTMSRLGRLGQPPNHFRRSQSDLLVGDERCGPGEADSKY